MKTKEMKRNKGITLIALVITIIILKCIDENTKEKLIEILSPKSEENTGIIPISGTSEMSE